MLKSHEKFHSANGKRLVLVAEDEEINREILGEILRDEYEVIFAANGIEAHRLIQEHQTRLSIILLDLFMPGMNGLELLHVLRDDRSLQNIPVIVITSDQASEVESLTLGAADFIPKPYPAPGVILARIRRTIELFEDRLTIQTTERDPLTGLYNRDYFYHYANLFDQHHENTQMDAIVIDIHHFRIINERFGTPFGDEILRRIANNIRETIADTGGIVCRREADTFMIYLPHGKDYTQILENTTHGLSQGDEPIPPIHLHMGVYPKADHTLPIERRFDRAQMALNMIRRTYTKTIEIYDHKHHERENFEQQLVETFPQAIQDSQFEIYYQPKFDIRSDKPILTAAEALIRWNHPHFGRISPGQFIPLFENNGLIEELDIYVWKKVAAQIRQWKDTHLPTVPVSVNVSRIDMYNPRLADTIRDILTENRLEPRELPLEITESAYTRDTNRIIETVSQLRKNHFLIEMDDFGSGYSSLNMLTTLPIDTLKLDMDFVRNTLREHTHTCILQSIIEIAHYLSVPVIAEGVETEEQYQALKTIGCDIVQGYYLSKPIPPEEFSKYLQTRGQQLDQYPLLTYADQKHIPTPHENPGGCPITQKEQQHKQQDDIPFDDIANALVRGCLSICIVNTKTDEYCEYKADASDHTLQLLQKGDKYFEKTRKNAEKTIYPDDLPSFLAGFTKTNILSQLRSSQTYTITYRHLIQNRPAYVNMKIIPLNGVDATQIVIGISSIQPEIDKPGTDHPYTTISKALAGNYTAIYYIDTRTDHYIQFQANPHEEQLQVEATGTDFFETFPRDLSTRIHPDDLAATLKQLDRHNIYENLAAGHPVTITYRQLQNNRWKYTQLKTIGTETSEDAHIIIAISDIDEQHRREEQQLEALRQAKLDPLTKLRSKYHYQEEEKQINKTIQDRTAEPFAIVYCDLNNLKHINDTYGHAEGDEYIKQTARTISNIYKHSPVYRIGGDEFIAILRNQDYTNRQYLYKMITALNYARPVGRSTIIAVGMSEYDPDNDTALAQITNRADALMYQHKHKLKEELT